MPQEAEADEAEAPEVAARERVDMEEELEVLPAGWVRQDERLLPPAHLQAELDKMGVGPVRARCSHGTTPCARQIQQLRSE